MSEHLHFWGRVYRPLVRRFGRWYRSSRYSESYAATLQPGCLVVHQQCIKLPGLPAELHGLRIAQFSDLHLGCFVRGVDGAQVAAQLNALQADVIVFTGDLVDFTSYPRNGSSPDIDTTLNALHARLGVFAVLGNHDYFAGEDAVTAALARSGVRLLRNSGAALQAGGSQLWLAGVDCAQLGFANLHAALAAAPARAPVVLLAHEPDYADEAARDGRIALQLSGHSHGGQLRIAGLGPVKHTRMGRKYVLGQYRVGGMWLYVNPGVGAAMLPLRRNCPPEITVITLTGENRV
ncbi:MAG: metallophosphoesterase [Chloroflexi bacterium]|nr:MAG: metallophosphoesterase [Chloroflexota bacterium]